MFHVIDTLTGNSLYATADEHEACRFVREFTGTEVQYIPDTHLGA